MVLILARHYYSPRQLAGFRVMLQIVTIVIVALAVVAVAYEWPEYGPPSQAA
jgi:hypothetical protein